VSAALAIRPVESFDMPVLAGLHAVCFDQAWDQHWSVKSFTEILSMPGAGGRIAAIGDEPVGFSIARIAADEAELLLLGTHPGWRRAGHGHALLAHVLEALAASGAKQIYLEVAAPNFPARAFYRNAGFVQVGMRPKYYHNMRQAKPAADATADALILSRALVADNLSIK
jgi:ribosomal-protein-alanine N-acetyltransferase